MVVGLLLIVLHAILMQGYTGTFWGDFGRWSYEIQRFASGELPYHDFQWHFPPLAMWVVGSAARLVGTNLAALGLITSAVALLVAVCFVKVARQALGRVDALLIAACLLFAVAYAQPSGAPLPLGNYTPAVPVGGLCALAAAWCFVESFERRDDGGFAWSAALTGVFAGLAVLSKQDFWFPAAYLVVVSTVRSRQVVTAGAAVLVTLLGIGVIAATAGTHVLLPLAGGFGHVAITGGAGFPSWERLTVDLFVLSVLCGVCLLVAGVARGRVRIAPILALFGAATALGAVHVYASMHVGLRTDGQPMTPTQDALVYHIKNGHPLFRPAVGWLRERFVQSAIPVSLAPLVLALVLLRWKRLNSDRRVLLALLLGLAVTLRIRRAFAGSEWFEFLFTLPVVLASVELLLDLAPDALRRFRLATTGGLAFCAVIAYVTISRGPGTLRTYPAAMTTRGTVHWAPGKLRDYQLMIAQLDSIDPSRSRPLVAFGYSGGFNYFMMRRNPFPMTQDFYFSAFNADSVLRDRPAKLLLIENPFLETESWGTAKFEWRQWEQSRVRGPYGWYDRPRFNRLREGCKPVLPSPTAFPVYDCP